MTIDDARKVLREAGIDFGSDWRETRESSGPSPIMCRQKELLESLALLLERQIEEDHKKVAQAQQALTRLAYGGGRANGR
jgi:hypothetical protein